MSCNLILDIKISINVFEIACQSIVSPGQDLGYFSDDGKLRFPSLLETQL